MQAAQIEVISLGGVLLFDNIFIVNSGFVILVFKAESRSLCYLNGYDNLIERRHAKLILNRFCRCGIADRRNIRRKGELCGFFADIRSSYCCFIFRVKNNCVRLSAFVCKRPAYCRFCLGIKSAAQCCRQCAYSSACRCFANGRNNLGCRIVFTFYKLKREVRRNIIDNLTGAALF